MVRKTLAAASAVLAFATPASAFDFKEAGAFTLFYISIPLDQGLSRKDRQWSAGLQLQGKREYQAVNIDSRMLNFMSLNDIDAKWIIAGVVAAGAAAAIGGKDKGTTSGLQQQQTQHEQQLAEPCSKALAAASCRK